MLRRPAAAALIEVRLWRVDADQAHGVARPSRRFQRPDYNRVAVDPTKNPRANCLKVPLGRRATGARAGAGKRLARLAVSIAVEAVRVAGAGILEEALSLRPIVEVRAVAILGVRGRCRGEP
jgi:hypothetical protein